MHDILDTQLKRWRERMCNELDNQNVFLVELTDLIKKHVNKIQDPDVILTLSISYIGSLLMRCSNNRAEGVQLLFDSINKSIDIYDYDKDETNDKPE